MNAIVPLQQAENTEFCGGKASSLARWQKLGFQVPDGFVATTTALRTMISSHAGLAALADLVRQGEAPDSAYAEMRHMLLELPLPAQMEDDLLLNFSKHRFPFGAAVRSSGICEDGVENSHAGLHDSVLGVQEAQLVAGVRRVWASGLSERSVSYRQEKRVSMDPASHAVLVHGMVDAKISGVTFTRDPTSPESNQMMVEMCWGLGESLVSGSVTPERLLVDRESLQVCERQPGSQDAQIGLNGHRPVKNPARAKLPEGTLTELFHMCIQIDQIAETPCDIEWSVAEDGIWLLQARPITKFGAKQSASHPS
ncbi:PEP/pyruvate-binding domain-containing protein [Prosthecobacter sp.]|uniref:PEP/pyruvate-binding domain-containing protein n=1 Tax=Prosthecobacter sp. TaxID=1965333 RepID=UPI0037851091